MNIFALLLGVSVLLIPNILFALWITWVDLTDEGTLTKRGQSYVRGLFAFIAVSLIIMLIGIVGYIETA